MLYFAIVIITANATTTIIIVASSSCGVAFFGSYTSFFMLFSIISLLFLSSFFSLSFSTSLNNFRKPIDENRNNLKGKINMLKEDGMDRIKDVENSIKLKIAELKSKLGEIDKLESEKEKFNQEMEMIVKYKENLDLLLKI